MHFEDLQQAAEKHAVNAAARRNVSALFFTSLLSIPVCRSPFHGRNST
jgi:hypothetical protein